MRRRFGRRRGRGSREGGTAIDAARWLQRILDDGVVAASGLEPIADSDVPDDVAAVGAGEAQDGTPLLVGFAPRSGGDAALAAVSVAAGREASDEGFAGEVLAVAPQWSTTSRQRLGMLRDLPFRFRALAASSLADGDRSVEPEPFDERVVLSPSQVAAHLTRAEDRALFERAAAALEGLASKHGGAVRGVGRSVELVVLARRSAELRADESGVILTTLLPQRATTRLAAEGLAEALDRLEGNLRRRLNDRRTREGEDGLRSRAVPVVAESLGLRQVVPWPLGGSDHETLDLAGVDGESRPVLAAVRRSFGLADLGGVLDALVVLRGSLAGLLSRADAPLRLDAPRLVLAAERFDPSAARVMPLLALGHELLELREARGGALTATSVAAGEAAAKPAPARARRARPDRVADEGAGEAGAGEEPQETERAAGAGGARRGGRRRGGRRRGGRGDGERAGEERADETASPERADEAAPDDDESGRFEELSLFDLDEERGDDDEGRGRRRRGRGRRRGRRGGGNGSGAERDAGEGGPAADEKTGRDDAAETDTSPPGRERGGRARGRGRRGGRREERPVTRSQRPAAGDDEDEGEGDGDDLLELADADVPDLDEVEEPRYEEDEDEEADPELDRLALEREKRRRARVAKSEPEARPQPKPRRRAAILAHADPDSIFSAILLARDIRLLEGFWIYPQSELMTFFRSVATDLRDEAPIFVVGFQPRPARDVIQAASLYADRLVWFDHREWPPEDREGLKQALGEDALHLSPGAGTSLAAVLATGTRRSRFSDKLVDLRTGRFTQHDYERWGRLWWRRILELVDKPGERRADIEPLLAGRPSDLAKEAARVETPPAPEEIQFVASRDFRVVHFSGHVLVVVEVPEEGVDLHLAARIARERYGASLSLARQTGGELAVLAGDDLPGRRSLDFGGLVDHLATKLQWVEALPDDDHVARLLIRDVAARPERLDEVLSEIAMGRSILEG